MNKRSYLARLQVDEHGELREMIPGQLQLGALQMLSAFALEEVTGFRYKSNYLNGSLNYIISAFGEYAGSR